MLFTGAYILHAFPPLGGGNFFKGKLPLGKFFKEGEKKRGKGEEKEEKREEKEEKREEKEGNVKRAPLFEKIPHSSTRKFFNGEKP